MYLGHIALLLCTAAFPGCEQSSTPPPVSDASHLLVLGDSTTVVAQRSTLVSLSDTGRRAWSLHLKGGPVVAPLSGAPDSGIYVRVLNAIHLVAPNGDLAWSLPMPQPETPEPDTWAPVATTDSSVVIMTSSTALRAIDRDGEDRWTVNVPDGHVVARPVVSPNGNVLLQTGTRVFCYSPTGEPLWNRALVAAKPKLITDEKPAAK